MVRKYHPPGVIVYVKNIFWIKITALTWFMLFMVYSTVNTNFDWI